MPKHHIDVSVTTPAPAGVVYGFLRDGASWPQWSPIEAFELTRKSDDGDEGVGAVRVFRTGRIRSQERIVELIPDRRFSYVLEKGLAIRGYRADVDLSEGPDGTTIRWRSSFDAKVPGTGGLYRRTLTRFITQCAHGLAAHATTPSSP
ncbi:SRPBCC family protein [Phytoactinopolyspora alkaliphila]|uniref:SRPBCC family protein n=1 Tax=Phytoactinopolyspora alkaliphila TaxID=1783498 RepID=A0A6N9YP40_9ACTN|nr:SRPBCC family protein [Phytoactinopolyspora alkaliphila]NED96717.1 SRPBCC family protein [Phytoactinopolyspora alkaliphila]